MKTIIKNISLWAFAVSALVSCERKPIYDDCVCKNTLTIPIDVDWGQSGISLQNVTVLFYNTEDGSLAYEYFYEHNSDDIQYYVSLAEGSYTAVIFNELRDQIDGVRCIDYDNLSTLKFESSDAEPLRSRLDTRSYVNDAGDLAVVTIENIVITEDMIAEAASEEISSKSLSASTKATVESLMGVVPKRKNTTIKITAHIYNIYYARMALGDLTNLADGYYVYGDKNSSTPSTLQFTMNNRVYDEDSYFDGTISATINTFGTLVDRSSTSGHDSSTPIMLDILFKLIDEDQTETSLIMEVTDLITQVEQSDGSILMTIYAEFEDELPKVEPEESGGNSGFGADLSDWTEVDVPLKQ